MNTTTAIAQHLNIASQAIIEVQEWASVIWVKFIGGCRFVSKKIMDTKLDTSKASEDVQNRIKWYFELLEKGKQKRADYQVEVLKKFLAPLKDRSQLAHMICVQEQYKVDCQVINAFLASI